MDQALIQIGLPVHCAWGDCEASGFVKPKFVDETHGGWYKSKMFRMRPRKRWFCPDHYEEGRAFDNRFYENFRTPDPYPADMTKEAQEELYKLLD